MSAVGGASGRQQKSAAVFAVRRANYTHRRKGVFNAEIIEDLRLGGNVLYRTEPKAWVSI